jgi:hypothetical protein
MDSKNANFLRQGVMDRCRRMTPAQRVKAFLEHSRLMKAVRKAGESRRKNLTARKPDRA